MLRDVSFEVAPGERVGIVGATGAGKTSIISLLMRFYDVQRGRILVDGVDIREMRLENLRARFGLVLQDVHLFSGTIADNIRLGRGDITDAQVRAAAAAVHAADFIERLPAGYEQPVAERGATLSVGQKQLLSFARALAHDPKVLILDEATSSIDTVPLSEERIGRSSAIAARLPPSRLFARSTSIIDRVMTSGSTDRSSSISTPRRRAGVRRAFIQRSSRA